MAALATVTDVAEAHAPHAVGGLQSFYVGTRKSKLALVQTDMVVEALATARPEYKFHIKARDTAAGDIDKTTPFKDMPVKNLWTHELEAMMMDGSLDILVHCVKDVPTQLPPTCEIGAILAREDPRDAFVLKAGRPLCSISDLPAGAVIGTSSIRRTAQIALKYPHLRVEDMRGNVGTRLQKLDAEDSRFDAVILAAAGLIRLDLGHRISQFLDSSTGNMLYAVGQGAIGIENRSNDVKMREALSLINHMPTYLACLCERSLLRTIEGGCSAPLGVETRWMSGYVGGKKSDSLLQLKAIVVSIDGQSSSEIDLEEEVITAQNAEAFGVKAASELLQRGADRILAEIKAKKPTEAADLQETT